jgi:hypothetical protein
MPFAELNRMFNNTAIEEDMRLSHVYFRPDGRNVC